MEEKKVSILKEIYDGWKNFIFENKEVEALAKERMEICVDCQFFRTNKTCEKCGCYMPAKTRSPHSKCPENFWLK